jgi:alpha-D-ribose 1-methylphosphonate 5-triphosphate synthase subunit PhnL
MTAPSAEDLLIVEGLDKTFTLHLHGGVRLPVVSQVRFRVARGECVVLDGPSGVGKSSILKIVFGNYRPDTGRILLADRDSFLDIAGADPRAVIVARRRVMGYVSQFLRVIPRVPTIDVVAAVRVRQGSGRGTRVRARLRS